jgi:putative membrane protein
MMRKSLMAAAVLAAAAVPGAATAQSPTGQDLTPEGRGAYVAMAGATDLYEVRSAELALERAHRPDVREFAQAMLTEHRRAAEELEAIARAVGLEDQMPPAMLPMHWDMLRQLERASASRFDRVYVDQQIEVHDIGLRLHRHFAERGYGPRLKAHADAILPVATRHLENARRLDQ